jgi:hypothetical protein
MAYMAIRPFFEHARERAYDKAGNAKRKLSLHISA